MNAQEFFEASGISQSEFEDYQKWYALLCHWNRKINIVSRETISQFWSRHALDSQQIIRHFPSPNGIWIDMGSGGGFPAIGLAIYLKCYNVAYKNESTKSVAMLTNTSPSRNANTNTSTSTSTGIASATAPITATDNKAGDHKTKSETGAKAKTETVHRADSAGDQNNGREAQSITGIDPSQNRAQILLVETNGKKCNFLRTVIRELKLPAKVLQMRVEDLADHFSSFDQDTNITAPKIQTITARAFAPLPKILALCAPIWQEDTIGIFPKGRSWQTEITDAEKNWSFDFTPKDSQTAEDAKILQITKIKSKLACDD